MRSATDLDGRLVIGFLFGMGGIAGEMVAGFLGIPTSQAIVNGCVAIILGTFGVGGVSAYVQNRGAEGPPQDKAEREDQ